MSQLSEILSAQKTLEESFAKRMSELEAQIQCSGPAKDTVAKVAEEFRSFRELIFSMLGLLRRQILECSRMCDSMETRQRRKALIFSGIVEAEKENCKEVIVGILNKKLALKDITGVSIEAAHRLGNPVGERHRPILVRFRNFDHKAAVWRAKIAFKGSPISVKEFLTKARQSVFSRARSHFGMRSCWTQDGVIIIRAPDGSRSKITTIDDLNPLMAKYPDKQGSSSTGISSGAGCPATSAAGATRNASRRN